MGDYGNDQGLGTGNDGGDGCRQHIQSRIKQDIQECCLKKGDQRHGLVMIDDVFQIHRKIAAEGQDQQPGQHEPEACKLQRWCILQTDLDAGEGRRPEQTGNNGQKYRTPEKFRHGRQKLRAQDLSAPAQMSRPLSPDQYPRGPDASVLMPV